MVVDTLVYIAFNLFILHIFPRNITSFYCSNFILVLTPTFSILFSLLTHFSVNRIINTQKARNRGGVSMATSSITHNFVVSNPNSVKRFVAAIDEADRDRTPKQTLPGRQLTNPQEILDLMSKRKK